jgi:phenylacetate-CoA ligase
MISSPFIQEKIILPCSDILTGQSVYKHFNLLMQTQHWSRIQIDDFQNKRLRLLIAHAYENVPYYREQMDKIGLQPSDIQTKENLKQMPVVTKDLIKKEGIQKFTAANISAKHVVKSASSGSTGEPLHFLITKQAYSMNIAANLRGWYSTGWRLGDKYVKLSQNLRKDSVKQLQDWMTNNKYLATNPLIDENYEFILQQIEKYKPKVIRCYPDPLVFIARYKKEHSKFQYSPNAITTTGNTLFPEIRKEIEDAFGCKVFDSYSCEGTSCIFECPSHTCYHSTEEYGISEVVDESGKTLKTGVGKLISTDLWNFVHPFIRYDTQDLVDIDDSHCECGRNHLKILRILGRDNEVLTMPTGRKFIVHNFTGFFQMDISKMKKCVDQFQVVKKKNDSVVFKLVVNKNFDKEAEEYLINFWEKELDVPVTVELLREIPIMQNSKRRFIVNE